MKIATGVGAVQVVPARMFDFVRAGQGRIERRNGPGQALQKIGMIDESLYHEMDDFALALHLSGRRH